MNGERVLVTGAYGLIGHEAALMLGAAGFEALPTDLLPERPPDAAFTAAPLAIAGVEPLLAFLKATGVSAIVHAAGLSGPMLGRGQPHLLISTNAGGTLDLYEAARLAGVHRIVFISSAAAYGETGEAPVDERTPLRATGAYGVSKICSERIAQAYAGYGVETVILRPCWVYGPRRRTMCVLKTMVADALAGTTTRLPYGAGFPRQFVHVRDVAEAIVAALKLSPRPPAVFNLADGGRYLLDEAAGLVRARLPQARIEMASGPDPDDVVCGPMDISAAAAGLAWRPKIDLPAGIEQMIAELSGRA